MLARIKETDENVPYRRDGWFYYTRTEAGKQYPIYARRHGSMDSAEQVTLDLNAIGEGKAFVGIGAYVPSDDGNRLAFTLDTTGYRQYVLYVKDLRTGAVGAPMAERVDGRGLVDRRHDADVRARRTRSRSGPTWPSARSWVASPEVVFEEKDDLYDLTVSRTRSKGYFLLICGERDDDRGALCAGEPAHRACEGHRAADRRAGVLRSITPAASSSSAPMTRAAPSGW